MRNILQYVMLLLVILLNAQLLPFNDQTLQNTGLEVILGTEMIHIEK